MLKVPLNCIFRHTTNNTARCYVQNESLLNILGLIHLYAPDIDRIKAPRANSFRTYHKIVTKM